MRHGGRRLGVSGVCGYLSSVCCCDSRGCKMRGQRKIVHHLWDQDKQLCIGSCVGIVLYIQLQKLSSEFIYMFLPLFLLFSLILEVYLPSFLQTLSPFSFLSHYLNLTLSPPQSPHYQTLHCLTHLSFLSFPSLTSYSTLLSLLPSSTQSDLPPLPSQPLGPGHS